MTDLPDVKIRSVVSFPSNVLGGNGTDVEKINGTFKINLAFDDFMPPVTGLLDPANQNALIYNPVTGIYSLTPIAIFGGAGGITDSPHDGVLYGRQNAAWAPSVAGPAGVAADARIAVFNGTTGNAIEDGGFTIADLSGAGSGSALPSNASPKPWGAPAPGLATPYSREDHVHPVDENALAYSGMQINGSMEVDQEAAASKTVPQGGAPKYTADGWSGSYIHAANTAVVAIQQAGVVGIMPPGFQNCIQMQASTAFSSPAHGDLIFMGTRIEGYRVARLGFGSSTAQPVTIGFWIFSNNTVGTMTLSLNNNTATRTYLANFTINVQSTWEYKTITIPGDVTGTWEKTNLIGLRVNFCGGGGTDVQGTNNAWQAGNFFSTSATTNMFAVNNNAVLITGVVVLPGIEAPSAARSALIMRPYPQELQACLRYFWACRGPITANMESTTKMTGASLSTPVQMLTSPTVTMITSPTWYDGSSAPQGATSILANRSTADALNLDFNMPAPGFTLGRTPSPYIPGLFNVAARL